MASPPSTICKSEKGWSKLPPDLLSRIADSLGIIDLLGFRGACKAWRSASTTASAEPELHKRPWFLLHAEQGSECTLLSDTDRRFILTLPEMDGSTCLASCGGWLLLFRESSLFFFCPFSRFRIDLPRCPFARLSSQIAAFSSPPTSPDCTVAIVWSVTDYDIQLHLLDKGSKKWKERHHFTYPKFQGLKGAAFQKRIFHLIDGSDTLTTFNCETFEWRRYIIVSELRNPNAERMSFYVNASPFATENIKEKLGLANDVSVSTCPAVILRMEGEDKSEIPAFEYDILIKSESIEAEGSEIRPHKGIWIQPRYFHVSPDVKWLR